MTIVKLEKWRDAHRPHVVLDYSVIGKKKADVLPLETFRRIRDGHLRLLDVEGFEDMMRVVIHDWLLAVEGQ